MLVNPGMLRKRCSLTSHLSPLTSINYLTKKFIIYEKRNLEDRHSADCVNPHGSSDCPWNYELHGPRPNSNLKIQNH